MHANFVTEHELRILPVPLFSGKFNGRKAISCARIWGCERFHEIALRGKTPTLSGSEQSFRFEWAMGDRNFNDVTSKNGTATPTTQTNRTRLAVSVKTCQLVLLFPSLADERKFTKLHSPTPPHCSCSADAPFSPQMRIILTPPWRCRSNHGVRRWF